MRTLASRVFGGTVAWLCAATASATIIGGGVTLPVNSQFIKLAVPFTESTPDNTVGDDNFQSDDLFGFDEGQNIVIVGALNVDFLASTGTVGVLLDGTTVASHYIVWDPNSATVNGFVLFDADILAVLSTTTNLAASDFLINTGVTYENPTARGLEGNDSFAVDTLLSPRRIDVDFVASTPGDVIRVLTAFSPGAEPGPSGVPEPTTALLLFAGLVGIFASLRRRPHR